MDSYINAVTIDTQFSYQRRFGPKCILIVFDPLRTRRSNLSIKAVRLTQKFMQAISTAFDDTQSLDAMKKKYSKKTSTDAPESSKTQFPGSIEETVITQDVLTKLNFTFDDIFEQVPIEITNKHLVQSYLSNLTTVASHQLTSQLQTLSGDSEVDALLSGANFTQLQAFDSLDLSSAPFLERALENLIESSDYLTSEQLKYQNYQRRLQVQKQYVSKKKEKTQEEQNFMIKSVTQPNQLDALMVSNQISNTALSVNRFAAQSMDKLYLADSLLKH